jgi:hypothetical protein
MAFDVYYDWSVDPFNSDAVTKLHVCSSSQSGCFCDLIAPASPTFPNACGGSPSRYFLYTHWILEFSCPQTICDETSAVELTRVSGAPGTNEYRIPTTDSNQRNVIEFDSGQAGHTISFDMYVDGSMLPGSEQTCLCATCLQISKVGCDGICASVSSCKAICGAATCYGIWGIAACFHGVLGCAACGFGVSGYSNCVGVFGCVNFDCAVLGCAPDDKGVVGIAGDCYGVCGCAGIDVGICGQAACCYGVFGCADCYAVCGEAITGFPVSGNAAYHNSTSSRSLKTNNETICIIGCYRSCPDFKVEKWQYNDYNQRGYDYFIGPYADDLKDVFELTVDDSGIYSPAGIALGATIELTHELDELKKRVKKLEDDHGDKK